MVNKLVKFVSQALRGSQYQVSPSLSKHRAKSLVRLQMGSDVDHVLSPDLDGTRNKTGTEQRSDRIVHGARSCQSDAVNASPLQRAAWSRTELPSAPFPSSMSQPKPAPKPRTLDDLDEDEVLLDELPPLDDDNALLGDEIEEALDLDPEDAADDAYDDRESEDLPGEDEPLELLEDGNDAEDAKHLDVGGEELDTEHDEDENAEDLDAPGIDEEHDTDELTDSPEDGGEEGLGEPIELSLDEQLPALDDEDESGFEEAFALGEGLLDPSFAPLPPSDPSPWVRLSPLAPRTALRAIAAQGAMVLTAGNTVHHIAMASAQAEEVLVSAEGPFSQVAISQGPDSRAALLATSGEIWLLDEAGVARLQSPPEGQTVTDIGWAKDTLLTLTEHGVFGLQGDGWHVVVAGATLALATSNQGDALIARREQNALGLYLLPHDQQTQLALTEAPVTTDGALALAVNDRCFAMATADGLLLARGDKELRTIERCTGVVAMTFAGDGVDAPLLLALTRDDGQRLYLASVDGQGAAAVVAELALFDEEPEVGRVALGWDTLRNVVWIATVAGLCAYGPRKASENTH